MIHTENFSIQYKAESESLATAIAEIAEDTHQRFISRLGLRPRGKVLVILQERYDVVNALAIVAVHRTIVIFPHPPYGELYGALGHYDNWLRLAFTHEYAHILDLERTEGLWELFGLATGFRYPNVMRPLWTLEGFAIWCESNLAGGGRIGSPTTEMIIRTDILEGRFRNTAEWSGAYEPWPGGSLPYYYGAAFMQYLHEHYGSGVPTAFRAGTSGALPFKYASSLPILTRGKPFNLVLAEFYVKMKADADSTADWIRRHGGPHEGELVARIGSSVQDYLPRSQDSDLWLVSPPDHEEQQILQLNPQTGTRRTGRGIRGVDVRLARGLAEDELVYSELEIHGNTDLVTRLHRLDAASGASVVIAGSEHLLEPAICPAEGVLLACRRSGGRSRLVLVREGEQTTLDPGLPTGANVFHPAWAPAGRQFAASVWQPPGRQNIHLFESTDGHARPLTSDDHWDIHPTFSADGRFVLFASDRTGVWNIYARDVAGDTLRQVTNVLTGAFLPKASPDGAWVYFVLYTGRGDEIRRVPADPTGWPVVVPAKIAGASGADCAGSRRL